MISEIMNCSPIMSQQYKNNSLLHYPLHVFIHILQYLPTFWKSDSRLLKTKKKKKAKKVNNLYFLNLEFTLVI